MAPFSIYNKIFIQTLGDATSTCNINIFNCFAFSNFLNVDNTHPNVTLINQGSDTHSILSTWVSGDESDSVSYDNRYFKSSLPRPPIEAESASVKTDEDAALWVVWILGHIQLEPRLLGLNH